VQTGHPLLTLMRAFDYKLLSNGLEKVWELSFVERLRYRKKNADVSNVDRVY